MDEDQEICRVCRCEATVSNPFYYPCKCAGSIRFVHQNCLLEWLSHSKKKYCELCEHPFIFTPIYRQDMPTKIPASLLISQCLSRCGTIIKTGFRALVVAIVWLVLLPYTTLWSLRFYIWSSESIGNGDFTNIQQLSSSNNGQTFFEKDALSSSLILFDYNFRKFLTDCFEGQVVALLIIAVVVAAYLFREWVVQNAPVEANRESEMEQDDLETRDSDRTNSNRRWYQDQTSLHNDMHDTQPVSPLARQKVAIDVLLAALGNMDDNDNSAMTIGTPDKNDIKCKLKDLQHDLQHEIEHQRKQHRDPHSQQHRLFNDNLHCMNDNDDLHQQGNSSDDDDDDDDEAEIEYVMQSIMIKNPADAFKRYSWDDLQKSSNKQKQQRQQSPLSNHGSQQRTPAPYSSPPINKLFDNPETMLIGRSSTTIATLEGEFDHTNMASFSCGQRELPKTTTRTDLYCQHHQHQPTVNRLSATSPPKKKHRHDIPHTNIDDILGRPLISAQVVTPTPTPTAAPTPIMTSDDISFDQHHVSSSSHNLEAADHNNARRQQQGNNDLRREPRETFDINDEILNDIYHGDNDEFDLGDDIDGVLEAIGMRGNPWILLQNSVLACVIVSLCLGIAVWIPHVTGRLMIILVHPISFIKQVVYALRYVTDPIINGILNGGVPLLLLAAQNLNTLLHGLVPGDFILAGRSILTDVTTIAGSLAKYGYSLQPHSSPSLLWWHNGGMRLSPFDNLRFKTNHTTIMARHSLADQRMTVGINEWLGLLLNTFYTISGNATQRWSQFAVGKSALDRGICIMVGYVTLLTVGSWFLSHHQQYQQCDNDDNAIRDRPSSTGIREFIRQQSIFFKVFSFIMLELAVLPIICGILLDLATLPLIEQSSVASRWLFAMAHPYCSCFLHWFVGTGFMFHFAVFITLCREIVRPGVMWFIRDPNDPQFHPVQEIMERPLLLLLRKLCTGALIYLALIVLGMGTVTWAVSQYAGIYPLRWSFDEPLSTLAIDILAVQFLVPLLIAYIKPRDFSKQLLTLWWRTTSRWLRLSSFMFGERCPEEEGTFIWHSFKSWLFCKNWPTLIAGCSSLPGECGSGNGDVYFKADGQLVRVPKRDSVMVHPRRSMIVPVDPHTLEPLDPMDKYLGHPASTEDDGGEEHNTTIVYIPPQFKLRMALFLFLMWFSGSVITCSVTVAPLLLGRSVFETYLAPNKVVHDLYSFILGAYLMVLGSKIINLLSRTSDCYLKRHEHGGWMALLDKTWTFSYQKMVIGCKFIYLALAIGWIIPLLVGVAMDIYIFTPLRYTKTNHHVLVLHLSEDWSFGIVFLGIVYGIIYILPTNGWQRALDRYVADGWMALDVWILTNTVLGPWILGPLFAALAPGGLAYALILFFDVQDASMKLMIVRYTYSSVLCLVTLVSIITLATKLARLWIQSIRDDTYLVGKQLHNVDFTNVGRPTTLTNHSRIL